MPEVESGKQRIVHHASNQWIGKGLGLFRWLLPLIAKRGQHLAYLQMQWKQTAILMQPLYGATIPVQKDH